MIAHNASFDRRFVHALWDKVGKIFPANLWLDTKALTSNIAKKHGLIKPKLTLESTLKIANVTNIRPNAHNAIVDTQNTYKLWKQAIDFHQIDYLPLIKRKPHS